MHAYACVLGVLLAAFAARVFGQLLVAVFGVEFLPPMEAWRTATIEGIERKLGELNLEYAAKRASGQLRHLEILPVRPGTRDAYKQYCLQQG